MTPPSEPSDHAEDRTILDEADLRARYRAPGQGALDKVVDHLTPAAADFVARSPLAVLSTGDDDGITASPRGGPPGFVRVLDPRTLAFGDLTGNNRLDSYANLTRRPEVGLLFFVPTAVETLRVNGTAAVTVDEDVRRACALDGRVPKVAVVVTVGECYLQCGAALRRSAVWDTSTWPTAPPSAGEIVAEATGADAPAAAIDASLQDYYATAAWTVGGSDGREPADT